MQFKQLALTAALATTVCVSAQAQTEIQWWHSMTAVNLPLGQCAAHLAGV